MIFHTQRTKHTFELNIIPIRTGLTFYFEGFGRWVIGVEWLNDKHVFALCFLFPLFTVSVTYDKDAEDYAEYFAKQKP